MALTMKSYFIGTYEEGPYMVPNPSLNPMEEVIGNLIVLRDTYNNLDDQFQSSVSFR